MSTHVSWSIEIPIRRVRELVRGRVSAIDIENKNCWLSATWQSYIDFCRYVIDVPSQHFDTLRYTSTTYSSFCAAHLSCRQHRIIDISSLLPVHQVDIITNYMSLMMFNMFGSCARDYSFSCNEARKAFKVQQDLSKNSRLCFWTCCRSLVCCRLPCELLDFVDWESKSRDLRLDARSTAHVLPNEKANLFLSICCSLHSVWEYILYYQEVAHRKEQSGGCNICFVRTLHTF